MAPTLASALTLSTVNLGFRAWLKFGTRSSSIEGLPILLKALEEGRGQDIKGKGKESDSGESAPVPGNEVVEVGGGRRRRGVVTICNHNSVVDDPLMWSLMPVSTYFPLASPTHTSRHSRWTLGARDIMFTNPVFSKFFELGQVINTERGGGMFQPAVDEAVQRLQDGEWIHIFPEAKVNQPSNNSQGGLLRFKWGIGRIIMDSETMPEIIPMWVSGFDTIMPESRTFPRFLPRPGATLSVTIGSPITSRIQPLVDAWREIASHESGTVGIGGVWTKQDGGVESPSGHEQRTIRERGDLAEGKERQVRIKITEVLQEAVRELGEMVERKEGRFERGEWSQSRRMEKIEG